MCVRAAVRAACLGLGASREGIGVVRGGQPAAVGVLEAAEGVPGSAVSFGAVRVT